MADNYLEFSETLTHLTDEQVDWLQNQLETIHVIDGVEYTEDKLPDAANTGDGGDAASTGDGAWIGCRAYRDMDDYDPGYGENVGFDYSFSEDVDEEWGHHLWIYSQEHGYVDRVAHLVQKFLRMFRPDACWSLTYAGTCSKPRVGDFGGGAVFVTASDIKYFNAWEFVEQQEKRHKGKFRGDKTGTDGKAETDGPRIVVNVSGGVVQDVYCSDPQADLVIVDWDTDGCDPTEGGIVEVGRQVAHVAHREVYPLDKLAGTDVGAALSVFEQVSIQEVAPVCECEQPGHFRSGVPGILASVENGRLAEGAKVERCDSCRRYPSDKAAFEKLVELGIASSIASGIASREPMEPTLPTLPHAKQYIDAGGGFCPNCQSHQTEGDSVDFDGRHCTQRMRCLDCDAVWFDVYTLSSIEPRED